MGRFANFDSCFLGFIQIRHQSASITKRHSQNISSQQFLYENHTGKIKPYRKNTSFKRAKNMFTNRFTTLEILPLKTT